MTTLTSRPHIVMDERQGAKTCGCGCGAALAEGKRYVKGHNHRLKPRVKVASGTGCWIWQRGKSSAGYGYKTCYESRKRLTAHRWMYEATIGPVPSGLHLDHLCRDRACVNPAHLEPVTPAQNSQRGDRTKLTESDVRAIRSCADGPTVIAKRYGLTREYVGAIRRGRTWVGV